MTNNKIKQNKNGEPFNNQIEDQPLPSFKLNEVKK